MLSAGHLVTVNETDNDSGLFAAMFSSSSSSSSSSSFPSSNATEEEGEEEEAPMHWGMMGLSILIVATVSGNILVCLAVTWERRLQNMTNYFLMSLAIADLLVSLLVMPLAMVVELFGRFPLGQSLCVIWATMDVLLCTASIWHMCIMSMDRYFTLRYPIRYGRNKTKKMMVLKITVVWLISFAVSVPLAIFGFVDYRNVYSDGKCHPSIKNFILYGSIFAFYVPLIIMVVTYTLTIRILRLNRALMSGLNGGHRQPTTHSTAAAAVESLRGPAVIESAGGGGGRQRTRRYGGGGGGGGLMGGVVVGVSPQQSGYTITSAGLTSVKCSSTDSPMSPTELRNYAAAAAAADRTSPEKRLTDALRVGLTDAANYLSRPLVITDADRRGTTNSEGIPRKCSLANPASTLFDRPPIALSSSSSSSSASSSSSSLRVSRSQPIFLAQSIREDLLLDPHPSMTQSCLVLLRSSESNLTRTRSSHLVVEQKNFAAAVDRKPNGTIIGGFLGGDGRPTANDNDEHAIVEFQPTRLIHPKTSNSLATVSESHSLVVNNAYVYLTNRADRFLAKKSSYLTTQSSTDSDAPSPRTTGRYRSVAQESPLDQRSAADGSEAQPSGVRIRSASDVEPDEKAPTSYLALKLLSNGEVRRSLDVISVETGRRAGEPDETLRFLVSPQGSDFYRPAAGGPARSWSLYSPSNDTSPSRSESRSTYVRSRTDHYRRGRKRRPPPQRPCARKIGLFMSKSRSTNEEKASKVLGIIFAVFVFFWTPFFTMNLVSVLCEHCMDSVTPSMMTLMVWLGYLSSLANPIIYTMFSISFRTVFYRILTCQYRRVAGCVPRRRHTSDERFLWSSRNKRSSCLKEFRSEFKLRGS